MNSHKLYTIVAILASALLIGCKSDLTEEQRQDYMQRTAEASCHAEGLSVSSPQASTNKNITISNSSGEIIHVYWLNSWGHRQDLTTLSGRSTTSKGTFTSHPWLFADKDDNCLFIIKVYDTNKTTIRIQKDKDDKIIYTM